MAKRILTIVALCGVVACLLLPSWASAQVVVEDITHQLITYDYSEDVYLPGHEEPIVRLALDLDKYQGLTLQVTGPTRSQVFLGKAQISRIPEAGVWTVPVDSLRDRAQLTEVLFTFVAAPETPAHWKVAVVDPNRNEVVQSTAMSGRPFQDRFSLREPLVILWFLLGLLIAVMYTQIPRIFLDYFSFTSIISSLQREEAPLKSSLVSRSNFFMTLLYGLALSTLGLLLALQLPSFQEAYFRVGNPTQWWAHLVNWLVWGAVALVLLWAKWMWLVIVGAPFNLNSLRKMQMYNYIRIGMVLFVPLSILLVSLTLVKFPGRVELYPFILGVLITVSIMRILLIYVKFRRSSSHRNVHLISYLCATEIAPAAVLLKLFYSI